MTDRHLSLLAHSDAWMREAACRGMGPKKFYPDRGEDTSAGKQICANCTVTDECKQHALDAEEPYGIWGGVQFLRGKPKPDQEPKTMMPTSLSASSVQTFLECPAKWTAEYYHKGRTAGGTAAWLGTACHEVFEHWIKLGHHQVPWSGIEEMMKAAKPLYDHAYHKLFSNGDRYAEGLKLVRDWLGRQDWTIREVLHTEEKKRFQLQVQRNPDNTWLEIPFTYIFDRVDRRLDPPYDGDIEVTDYKSYARPVSVDELKYRLQPRVYGLAAQLEYPDAKRIWVTYDLLRYGTVGTVFTLDDNRETYKFLREVAKSIMATDPDNAPEELGDGCRFCVRKAVCHALQANKAVGGLLGTDPPIEDAVRMRHDVAARITGLTGMAEELDRMLLLYMQSNNIHDEVEFGNFTLRPSTTARRNPDQQIVQEIVGAEMFAAAGKVGVKTIDEWISDKTNGLTDDQRNALRRAMPKQYGEIKPAVAKKK